MFFFRSIPKNENYFVLFCPGKLPSKKQNQNRISRCFRDIRNNRREREKKKRKNVKNPIQEKVSNPFSKFFFLKEN